MKDLKKYKDMPAVLEKNQQFFTEYPELLNGAAHALVTVDGVDKKTKERGIRKNFLTKRPPFGLLGDAFKLWRAFE
jgi:electron transfer flavoprotein-quinone oxidoreductase